MSEIVLQEKFLNELVDGLTELIGDDLFSIKLYGSYARNEQTDESDVDIALIVLNPLSEQRENQMISFISAMDLKHDKVFSVIDIEKNTFDQWVSVLPFYKNIQNEGVTLWEQAC